MADEQTILLDPEEELTSVRERLEKAQARRIYLIIPQQTRLRSHVGWRLIHARMRELGKELLVISPDRQVRAMARAAGFNVAESLESPGSRPRSGGTRPGNVTTRGAARSRVGSNRGGPESHVPPPRRRLMPSASSRPPEQSPADRRADYDDEATLERPGRQGQMVEGRPQIIPAAFLEESEERPGSAFGLRIDTTPSVRPSVPQVEEDDEEGENLSKYYHDYKTAQSIRESARTTREQPGQSAPSTNLNTRGSLASAPGRWEPGDRYAFMEDDEELSPLPEQKASVPGSLVEGPGADIPDISDRSTEIMKGEIEDLGDTEAPDLPQIGSVRGLEEPTDHLHEQEEHTRPRARTGQMQPRQFSPRAPRPEPPEPDYDELAAIQDRPTQEVRPLLSPSGELAGTGTRSSQTLRSGMPSQVGASVRAASTSQKAPGRQLMPPVAAPRQPAGVRPATRRRGRGWWVFIAVLVILLIAGSFLFYFVPSATVTVFLQARTYSRLVQLNATANSHANVSDRVPAQMLARSFSVSGQGAASGTTRVGNARAQGLVAFTNNGNQDIVVPTGTIVTTQSGIQFVTEAEAQVSHIPPNNTFPAVPVTAQQSGEIGNVPAGSITVIPQASLASIARYNNVSVSTVSLTVTNTQPTSKGGAANVPAVTTRDLQALTQTLHQKLQKEVSAWLATQVHRGDLRGVLIPDVLDSASPLPQEQLSGAPGAGQAASSGTFSGTLALSVRVLVVRAASLQAAAGAQLNAAALSLRPASMLAERFPVTLTNVQSKPSKDGSTLAITAKASGAIIARLSPQSISSNLAGRGVSQAGSYLKSSLPQAGIQNVQVSVVPAFLSILPLQARRIQIVLQPVQVGPPKGVPNG
ncbi:MAG TPA: baseplate J/gp47 family protein [Ktedonobacteraceae bacterium]|nr:baseplate J/gp47 family protein [Ktedonobacteraceae bacterium]